MVIGINALLWHVRAPIEQDEIIVHSTIQLAHNLGLGVVAEGVETEEVYLRLCELGCNDAQGYFIARPMDTETTEHWLTANPWMKGKNRYNSAS